MKSKSIVFIIVLMQILGFVSCEKQTEHIAPAIYDRDSVPTMTTYGVNQLISDSGVIKYRIVTERWEVYPRKSLCFGKVHSWNSLMKAFMCSPLSNAIPHIII